MDPAEFRNALACFASGVTVVTASGDERGPVGITVSSFCSVSLSPPLVLVCLDNGTGAMNRFSQVDAPFAVNVLAENQISVSTDFAGPQTYDLHGHDHRIGETGAPILDGVAAALECCTHGIHDGGDHRILVGRVVDLYVDRTKSPLIYFHSGYHAIGQPRSG